MDNTNEAVQKIEAAVDLVTETKRTKDAEDDEIKLTPNKVRQMMKQFDILDDDNSKTLDINELGKAFRLMGQNPTKKQLQAIASEADLDNSGGIDKDEFTRLLITHMQRREDVEKELRQAFAVFDTHGDGKVNQEDLISTLKLCGDEPLTDKEAETMVTLMDKDKDGLIDIEEFVSYLCKSIPVRYYMIKT